jgi:hypothetical protein
MVPVLPEPMVPVLPEAAPPVWATEAAKGSTVNAVNVTAKKVRGDIACSLVGDCNTNPEGNDGRNTMFRTSGDRSGTVRKATVPGGIGEDMNAREARTKPAAAVLMELLSPA